MLTVRAIDPSEFSAWVAAAHVPFFLENPVEPEVAFRLRYFDLSRCSAAFDDGRVVATYRSFATDVSVPGGLLPASAVTLVTVLPTHRRRGLLTSMMCADLRAAADRGEPISVLLASEYPIYGRYGFGAASDQASYELPGSSAACGGSPFAERVTGGAVDFIEASELRAVGPQIYDRSRAPGPAQRAGQILRRDTWWDSFCGIVETPWPGLKPGRIVVHRDGGWLPQGYLRYHVEEAWDAGRPASVLHIDELVAATTTAAARLWQFACEVDLVRTIRAGSRPVDESVRWLLRDARVLRQLDRVDGLWVRVLDVPRTLTGRRYAVDGSIVVEVTDPDGYAEGRWLLEGGPDGATCVRTTSSADLSLPAAVLGSCLLGGRSFRDWAAARQVDELQPGACARADAMFRAAPLPWCSTEF